MRKRFGQGTAPLHRSFAARMRVGVTAAVALSGCTPDEPVPAQMPRPAYVSQDACLQDWDSKDCTPAAPAPGVANGGGGSNGGGPHIGGGGYFGPWMYNGYYYHPYGGYAPLTTQPHAASGMVSSAPPPVVAHSFASRSAVMRGGMGSTASGHSSFSG